MESTGQAKAEAQSRAEASRIEGEAAVDQAKLKAQAMKIEAVRTQTHMLLLFMRAGVVSVVTLLWLMLTGV